MEHWLSAKVGLVVLSGEGEKRRMVGSPVLGGKETNMRIRYLSILVSTVMMAAALLGPSAAARADDEVSASHVEAVVTTSMRSSNVTAVVSEANEADVAAGIERLSKAPAFVDLLKKLKPDGKLLAYYAVTLSPSDIDALAQNTHGKHFELTRVDGRVQLSLESGAEPPVVAPFPEGAHGHQLDGAAQPEAVYGYACWQAYAAAFAFAIGLGMVCVPAGPWASLMCSGGSSLLFPINWDAACG